MNVNGSSGAHGVAACVELLGGAPASALANLIQG